MGSPAPNTRKSQHREVASPAPVIGLTTLFVRHLLDPPVPAGHLLPVRRPPLLDLVHAIHVALVPKVEPEGVGVVVQAEDPSVERVALRPPTALLEISRGFE